MIISYLLFYNFSFFISHPFHLLSCEAAKIFFFLFFTWNGEKRNERKNTRHDPQRWDFYIFKKINLKKKIYKFIVVERDSFIASVGMETSFFLFIKFKKFSKNIYHHVQFVCMYMWFIPGILDFGKWSHFYENKVSHSASKISIAFLIYHLR